MSDYLRQLVQPFGDVEPPLDLHNRITARESELAVPGRKPWHLPRVLVFAVAATAVGVVLVVLAIAAHSRSSAPAPANGTGPHNRNSTNLFGTPDCTKGDLAPAFEIRRPPPRQDNGVFQAKSHQPVVTIVVRNVSERRCYGRPAFREKILDRRGRTVGSWDDQGGWFGYYYGPGASRTFSLPDVYRCDRPGPFTALARVHGHLIRRGRLSLSEITCS
jgi:hypothetical protein